MVEERSTHGRLGHVLIPRLRLAWRREVGRIIAWEIGVANLGLGVGPTHVVRQAARSPSALFVLASLLVAALALGPAESHAASAHATRQSEAWPVEAAFRQAIQLWVDEQFDALWERGLLASRYRVSREAFARWMRHRVVKPTCCWGQIRGVRVHLAAAEEALVEAQVGFDVKTLGTTVVRSLLVYLRREEGEWRITLEDLLTKPEVGLPWDLPGPG
jgi:hypothetical protein